MFAPISLCKKRNFVFKESSPPATEVDTADSTLDSPTTSRAINIMDLDPNIMDEPYDSGFLQSSAPIPIRLANTFSCIFYLQYFKMTTVLKNDYIIKVCLLRSYFCYI